MLHAFHPCFLFPFQPLTCQGAEHPMSCQDNHETCLCWLASVTKANTGTIAYTVESFSGVCTFRYGPWLINPIPLAKAVHHGRIGKTTHHTAGGKKGREKRLKSHYLLQNHISKGLESSIRSQLLKGSHCAPNLYHVDL